MTLCVCVLGGGNRVREGVVSILNNTKLVDYKSSVTPYRKHALS